MKKGRQGKERIEERERDGQEGRKGEGGGRDQIKKYIFTLFTGLIEYKHVFCFTSSPRPNKGLF